MGHPEPDHWVDVTDHVDTAIAALVRHSSQLTGRDLDAISESMLKSRRERSVGKGMQYGESFRKISFQTVGRPTPPSATKP